MVRAIRSGTIVAILIGGVLGAGLSLPAAFSQQDEGACETATEPQPDDVGSAEVGGSSGDALETTAEEETAVGLAGTDCLKGIDGQDNTLIGGANSDELQGANKNDDLSGGSGSDTLLGGPGHDSLDGGNGSDTLEGGDGKDYIDGGNGRNTLRGGDGTDIIKSGGTDDDGNRDVIRGGDEADLIYLTGGRAEVWAGAGNDTVVAANGFSDEINCGDGDHDQVTFEPGDIVNPDCEEPLALAERIRKPG